MYVLCQLFCFNIPPPHPSPSSHSPLSSLLLSSTSLPPSSSSPPPLSSSLLLPPLQPPLRWGTFKIKWRPGNKAKMRKQFLFPKEQNRELISTWSILYLHWQRSVVVVVDVDVFLSLTL